MNPRLVAATLLALSLGLASSTAVAPVASAQTASAQVPSAQDPGFAPPQQDSGGWQQGQRRGRGMWGGGMMGDGRGLMGTVTAVTADHYSIRTETGEVFTVFFSVNTRIVKQRLRPQGANANEDQPASGGPEFIKASDIKIGDVIAAGGQLDKAAKSLGAVFIVQLDPQRARQMQQLEADYGKTWLMGRVTAIDGVKVTLEGIRDKTAYSFTADENTTFRHRREPITLADIHLGDLVRVEGAIKDGVFLATTVNDIGTPQETRMGRNAPGTSPPQPAPQSPPQPRPQPRPQP
ncbi:MAG TPA: DUF5666 domain-containing protein [Terracidiphilus sp.]|nr:DUF5666 domain-containing protein [Terracidiphilus sp.]